MVAARKQYIKMVFGGTLIIIIFIFAIFSVLYGSFFRTPARKLPGLVIDFDGGFVGASVVAGLTTPGPAIATSQIAWHAVPSVMFPGGLQQVNETVSEQQQWVIVTVNPGASDRLSAALANPNSTYNGREAVTIVATEARNENAYRSMIVPSTQQSLTIISSQFAMQLARNLSLSPVIQEVMTTSPQTLVMPISFNLYNLQPFNQPLATLVVFVGLIFVIILSFFVVVKKMISNAAREASGLTRLLRLRSLITVRLVSAFVAYFFISLFNSLLSVAFQLDIWDKFGRSSFLVFWMMNYCGMLALGLALESMITILGAAFVPFFLLAWIMINVAVTVWPIEVLPLLYHYGYAAPFYNITKIARTIIFRTRNRAYFHFIVLIIWTIISCISLTVFQVFTRRKQVIALRQQQERKRFSIASSKH
ncbi:Nitrosoguanidine resistance protein SNG1 [Leucoagaricus sp. SymC.cos]|nr:Nitrosoguanidine resistance protein SNG1 [Leucoagaricus sp. SymC.cos]